MLHRPKHLTVGADVVRNLDRTDRPEYSQPTYGQIRSIRGERLERLSFYLRNAVNSLLHELAGIEFRLIRGKGLAESGVLSQRTTRPLRTLVAQRSGGYNPAADVV